LIAATILGLTVMSVAFAVVLAVATAKFVVKIDPLAEQIIAALPGINCGACGYGGCAAYAEAVAAGKVPPGACIPGGGPVARKIAVIMGQEAGEVHQHLAIVHCNRSAVKELVEYDGLPDCKAAVLCSDPLYECAYACLGLGTCARACPFGAIIMSRDGLPLIIEEKCTGCGVCASVCPTNIISIQKESSQVHIQCRSRDKGAVARKLCQRSCIACGKCAKICPVNAIEIRDFLAIIDYNKCISCGKCVPECPTGAIGDYRKMRRKENVA
jgi:Na+-translocating ferredoxin:NAD+ oxidoreductase RNF subunit RnfB